VLTDFTLSLRPLMSGSVRHGGRHGGGSGRHHGGKHHTSYPGKKPQKRGYNQPTAFWKVPVPWGDGNILIGWAFTPKGDSEEEIMKSLDCIAAYLRDPPAEDMFLHGYKPTRCIVKCVLQVQLTQTAALPPASWAIRWICCFSHGVVGGLLSALYSRVCDSRLTLICAAIGALQDTSPIPTL